MIAKPYDERLHRRVTQVSGSGATMFVIAIAVAAYVVFGASGLGVVVALAAAATIVALASAPKPDEVAAVIGAVNATYPESSLPRIIEHLNPIPDETPFHMATVYTILRALEDEGTVETFTVDGEDYPGRRGLGPQPKLFWRVVRGRPRKRLKASPGSSLPRFFAPVPV